MIYKAIYNSEDSEKLQEDVCVARMAAKMANEANASKCFTMNVLHPRRNKIITPYRLHIRLLNTTST